MRDTGNGHVPMQKNPKNLVNLRPIAPNQVQDLFKGVHKTRLLQLFHEFELAVIYNEQLGLTHGETADGHQRLIYS